MNALQTFPSRSMPASTPSIDITLDSNVTHIDLTGLDDTPPQSPAAHGNDVDEPPRKRQRLLNHASPSRSRSLTACLKAQVKPYIDAQLVKLPPDVDKVEIGRQVLCRLGSSGDFAAEFTLKKGFLSPSLERNLAKSASQFITHYASKPEFQLRAEPAASPTFDTPRFTPSTPTPTRSLPRPSPATSIATAKARVSSASTKPVSGPSFTSPVKQTDVRNNDKPPVSPANYRTKMRAKLWKSSKTQAPRIGPPTSRHAARNAWYHMPRRPYLTTEERQQVLLGSSELVQAKAAAAAKHRLPFHVDFDPDELEALRQAVRRACKKSPKTRRSSDVVKEIGHMLRKEPNLLMVMPHELQLKGDLVKRDCIAIRNLLDELVDRHKRPPRQPKMLTLKVDEFDKQTESRRSCHISSLLLAREMNGNRGFGRMRSQINFTNEFRKAHEDGMEMRTEWVNCAGDIMTIAWTSNHNFICGTTTHSDSHNQQYNRDGNLLLCSSDSKRLKAFSDHRIPRPIVEKGENSTEAMRESQSPWLYSSVVSSDYDKMTDRAYTSSFDKTVKVWRVNKDGKDMTALGTWHHGGNVNFVAVSKSGMVATAADVPTEAVRVYCVDRHNVSGSPFRTYSGSRTWNEDDQQTTATQKWAYLPATMQWGLAEAVQHLLLVGYSPRSLSGDDRDIPDHKLNSGEICLWDCRAGERVKVMTASTQNVFEVAWHPTQPVFIVSTSPSGLMVDDHTRTQIRVFRPVTGLEGEQGFGEMQCLDCPAGDINELTIKPNSVIYSYITAACTDNTVYVWDTARGDKPIHALRHKEPIDKEEEDVGVKFSAWGTTADRFYTGGSDGLVKVWNVRNAREPLIRDLLEAPGCITCGGFSPDYSKLVVGDATGRVMLLSLDKDDEPVAKFMMPPTPSGLKPAGSRPVRRPLAFLRHDEPPPPHPESVPETGVDRSRHYVASGHLARHRDPTVGAVKGPSYSELGLYRRELHLNGDPSLPLLARTEEGQQENQKMFASSSRIRRIRRLAGTDSATLKTQHQNNVGKDLSIESLDEITRVDLLLEHISIDDPINDQGFDFDYQDPDYDEE